MSEAITGKCWHCGATLAGGDYGRENTCRACGKQTHVCRNCRWYAPSRPNQCAEPVAERVMNKERANFCGYFEPNPDAATADEQTSDDALRKAAEDLFKL